MKLTPEEEQFMQYWEQYRNRKRKAIYQLSWGLPLGLVLVIGIFINFLSGWYKRADMQFRADLSTHTSGFIVLLLAAIGIIVFIVVFSARHRWDQQEQRYRELQARKEKS